MCSCISNIAFNYKDNNFCAIYFDILINFAVIKLQFNLLMFILSHNYKYLKHSFKCCFTNNVECRHKHWYIFDNSNDTFILICAITANLNISVTILKSFQIDCTEYEICYEHSLKCNEFSNKYFLWQINNLAT